MYENPLIVDIFNIGILIIFAISAGYCSFALFKRYREKKKNVILTLSIGSMFQIILAIFLLSFYYFNIPFPSINLTEMEPLMIIFMFIIFIFDIVIFDIIKYIFDIPSDKALNWIRRILFTLLLICFVIFIIFYFSINFNEVLFEQLIIFQISTVLMIFGLLLIILFIFFILQGLKFLRKMELEYEERNKIRFMVLWCLFLAITVIGLLLIFNFSITNIFFGLDALAATISEYCLYRVFVQRINKDD